MKKFDKSDLVLQGVLFIRDYEGDVSYCDYRVIIPSLNIGNFPFKNLDILFNTLSDKGLNVSSLGVDNENGLVIDLIYVDTERDIFIDTCLSCLNSLYSE